MDLSLRYKIEHIIVSTLLTAEKPVSCCLSNSKNNTRRNLSNELHSFWEVMWSSVLPFMLGNSYKDVEFCFPPIASALSRDNRKSFKNKYTFQYLSWIPVCIKGREAVKCFQKQEHWYSGTQQIKLSDCILKALNTWLAGHTNNQLQIPDEVAL